MLPSTGNFKGINCPFFDTGLCERPYCHYKHVRKEFESQEHHISQSKISFTEGLQQLVSEAVKKVLQQSEVLPGSSSDLPIDECLVNKVVGELSPASSSQQLEAVAVESKGPISYKPTPISELKKRHIPIPYCPTLTKSTRVMAKRPIPAQPSNFPLKKAKLETEYDPVLPKTNNSNSQDSYNPLEVENIYSTSLKNKITDNSSSPLNMKDLGNFEEQHSLSYTPTLISNMLSVSKSSDSNSDPENYDPDRKFSKNLQANSDLIYIPQSCNSLNSNPSAYTSDSLGYESTLNCEISNQNSKEYIPTDKSKLNSFLAGSKALDSVDLKVLDKELNMLDEIFMSEDSNSSSTFDISPRRRRIKSSNHVSKSSVLEDKIVLGQNDIQNVDESEQEENIERKKDKEKETDINHKHDKKSKLEEQNTTNRSKDTSKHKHGHEKKRRTDRKSDHKHKESKRGTDHKSHSKKHSHGKDEHDKKHKKESKNSHEIKSSSETEKRISSDKSKKSYHSSSKKNSSSTSGTLERSRTEHKEKSRKPEYSKQSSANNDVLDFHADKILEKNEKITFTISSMGSEPEDNFSSYISEESSSDDEEQCLRIFQEYKPQKCTSLPEIKKKEEPPEGECVSRKKRIAHEGSQLIASSSNMHRRNKSMNPSMVMAQRLQKLKNFHIEQTVATNSMLHPSSGGKLRIAHVPNVSSLLVAKQAVQEQLKSKSVFTTSHGKDSTHKTIARSAPKTGQRIAHAPADKSILLKAVNVDGNSKIPANIRQVYLNNLSKEYLKLCKESEEAYKKAVDEEKLICDRSSTRQIYASLISNLINRIRKEANAMNDESSGPSRNIAFKVVSHTSVLAGKGGTKGTWSIEKSNKTSTATGVKNLYQEFLHYAMSESDLKQNGFPRSHPEEKGKAVIFATFKKPQLCRDPMERICSRCSTRYPIDKHGFPSDEEQCVYHWGRPFQTRARGYFESRYSCCQGDSNSSGCSVAPCHVCDNFDPDNLRGFVKTLEKATPPADGNYGVYALDCEMCYTTGGLELTRVTVIGTNLDTVYETLVKPVNPILDYNTRFSGITEEDMSNVTTSILDVQSALLSFVSTKTVLVGHSLESDFKALKLIHDTVVDTSVVFPHRQGPPKKRALKTLCRERLNKIIQEHETGHDSAEDAKACMELMLHLIDRAKPGL